MTGAPLSSRQHFHKNPYQRALWITLTIRYHEIPWNPQASLCCAHLPCATDLAVPAGGFGPQGEPQRCAHLAELCGAAEGAKRWSSGDVVFCTQWPSAQNRMHRSGQHQQVTRCGRRPSPSPCLKPVKKGWRRGCQTADSKPGKRAVKATGVESVLSLSGFALYSETLLSQHFLSLTWCCTLSRSLVASIEIWLHHFIKASLVHPSNDFLRSDCAFIFFIETPLPNHFLYI